MAIQNSILASPLDALSDGDAVASSPRATVRRLVTTVAAAEDAYRAELVMGYIGIGSAEGRREIFEAAEAYDAAHPDEASLVDELLAIDGLAVAA